MDEVLRGRFTADPEKTQTSNGNRKLIGRIAVNEAPYRTASGKEVTPPPLFFDVQAWNAVADQLADATKGSFVSIGGRWRAEEWEYEGKTQHRQYVLADSAHVFPRRDQEDQATPAASAESGEGEGAADEWADAK